MKNDKNKYVEEMSNVTLDEQKKAQILAEMQIKMESARLKAAKKRPMSKFFAIGTALV